MRLRSGFGRLKSLSMTCAGCGFEIQVDFAFCPRCGAAQRPAAAPKRRPDEADRRPVTVLFADLCGFTSLSERLDPEEVRAFQGVLFDSLGQAVSRRGGFVAKYLGDAVLALFGAPVAHEDDPERALEAALDMLAGAKALSTEWTARLGQDVTLHIAVHTGPVVAGSLGDGAGATYDVTGDTVNTASRLLGAAAPGTILVAASTQALVSHRFAFEPAGSVSLRGKAEPMAVHRLVGALAEPRSARGLAAFGLAAPMVGRDGELDRLQAAFARMQEGRAQLVDLAGDAGSGKSRLIAEFLGRLEESGRLAGTVVRRATCSSFGEPIYGVFAALFREGYGIEAGDTLGVAREKLAHGLKALGADPTIAQAVAPMLSYLLGVEEARPVDLDPEQLKRQIVLAARLLVERRLAQGPLLVIVDDFHWADAASVDLLRDLAAHLADSRLMILLAHRPDGRAAAIAGSELTAIRLAALSPEETKRFIDGLFGAPQQAAFMRLRDLILTRAGGNPLFVEEIVRSLVSGGVLVREGQHWAVNATIETVSLPPTLHGLLLSRVDKLPADTRRVLQAAAVLGVSFDEALLQAVAGDVGTALQRLVEADLVRDAGPARDGRHYRFSHALLRDVVYDNQLVARRGELHERAARALEEAVGPSPVRISDLEALGHHWSFTSDKVRAARYLTAAGDRARAVYANDDAIRLYERALVTLAGCLACEDQVRLVRERLADLLALTGRRADALAHHEAVRAELEAAGDRAGAARLHRKIGALHWDAGDRERARACFDAGLECLGEDGDPVERAQLHQELGRLAFRAGDNANAIAWAERALAELALADEPSDGDRARETAATKVQAYNTLGVALARMGQLAQAVGTIEQSIALAEHHDLLQATCRGYTNLSVLQSSLDPPRSIETCQRGLAVARRVGDLAFQSRLQANLAVAYCALTNRCEAEGIAAAEIAVDLDRRLGLIDHLAVPLIVLGQIRQCHGDRAPALAAYQEALALAEKVGEPQLLFPCYDGLATLHLDAGDGAKAELYLAKAQEVCERAGVEPDALLVLPFLY
ncbi:MAG: AAA family ATPase [Proteobacteria bacterium]|nr:AAA family ATPase [Pseudomonadota bacterium]